MISVWYCVFGTIALIVVSLQLLNSCTIISYLNGLLGNAEKKALLNRSYSFEEEFKTISIDLTWGLGFESIEKYLLEYIKAYI